MRIIPKEEFLINSFRFIKELKGKIFIYPTDTIYGIGCDATSDELVRKIRQLKNSNQPFSIIPPNAEWIFENCEQEKRLKDWIKKLPGPYTFILKLKNKSAVSKEATNGMNTIGVRIPDHWFTKVVNMMEVPIITTSANKTGENFMKSIDDLNRDIKDSVDFIIDEGEKAGSPSTLVHFEERIKIKER